MQNRKRAISTILSLIFIIGVAVGQRPVRFNNEHSDTTRITNILIELSKQQPDNKQQLVAMAAEKLLGLPYTAATLEHEPEMLTINMDQMDCTTLVETATALALTVINNRTSWRDFIYNLQQIRYRSGEVNGYASRLHYISDWIVDNNFRGILTEATDRIGNANYVVKTIDFMSQHRNLYPRLKDDETFAKIKDVEVGYRSHRFPIIKPQNLKSADLKDGDIIAIATSTKGLDVSHMGIIKIIDGVPHLLHASSKAKKVIIDPKSLQEYLRTNRSATGIRVFRIKID